MVAVKYVAYINWHRVFINLVIHNVNKNSPVNLAALQRSIVDHREHEGNANRFYNLLAQSVGQPKMQPFFS